MNITRLSYKQVKTKSKTRSTGSYTKKDSILEQTHLFVDIVIVAIDGVASPDFERTEKQAKMWIIVPSQRRMPFWAERRNNMMSSFRDHSCHNHGALLASPYLEREKCVL